MSRAHGTQPEVWVGAPPGIARHVHVSVQSFTRENDYGDRDPHAKDSTDQPTVSRGQSDRIARWHEGSYRREGL
ncbi:hypothetical protein NITLEN_10149 [Nitrospira lenta]|uniref:Uncharacterized protein n=1 Tax=Nitrospira lenta TaxID=1436998 RepID=A0A330L1H0_9BACT|nr:hypothetical protein NITLEN_10149 [Nitrospira lenta]